MGSRTSSHAVDCPLISLLTRIKARLTFLQERDIGFESITDVVGVMDGLDTAEGLLDHVVD